MKSNFPPYPIAYFLFFQFFLEAQFLAIGILHACSMKKATIPTTNPTNKIPFCKLTFNSDKISPTFKGTLRKIERHPPL